MGVGGKAEALPGNWGYVHSSLLLISTTNYNSVFLMASNLPAPIAQRPEPERIYLFVQHLGRRLREIDSSVGLTPARFSALASLHFHDWRNISDLAADERVKRPSMTR